MSKRIIGRKFGARGQQQQVEYTEDVEQVSGYGSELDFVHLFSGFPFFSYFSGMIVYARVIHPVPNQHVVVSNDRTYYQQKYQQQRRLRQ